MSKRPVIQVSNVSITFDPPNRSRCWRSTVCRSLCPNSSSSAGRVAGNRVAEPGVWGLQPSTRSVLFARDGMSPFRGRADAKPDLSPNALAR
jgi:hypothetical protein